MINRGLLLVFVLLLTLVGFISCGKDEEVPQEASLAEVSDDLVAAIRQGDVSLVTDIISANPERVSDILNTRLPAAGLDAGLTPLMIAARDIDNSELVKLLVSNGADASTITEPQGWTALLYALAFNKNDAVTGEVLKADNPNKNQKLAVAYQPTDADLLRKTPLRSGKNTGYVPVGATGLILATFISDPQQALSKVKLLTTSGVDLEVGDKDGRKAALYAAVHHNAAVLNVLLGAGADVKGLKDASGSTVLTHVVENGADVDVVDALVGAGLPVDEENKEGYTGLQWAAQKGGPKSADFISKLLAGGADVNKKNTQQEGRTALIFAVQGGHVGAVTALLDAEGIDIGQVDATGKTALAYATENAEIAGLIAAKSPSVPSLTLSATTLSFTATETEAKTVTITLSNADSWTVGTPTYTDGAGWLTATPGTGADVNTLTVTVSAHTGTAARRGSVALTPAQGSTNGAPVTLSVTQAGTAPSLTLSATTLSFTATGVAQTVTITLVNAESWSVGTPSATWITATPGTGDDVNTLTVTVSENTVTTDRSGSVELTPAGGAAVTLSVTQSGTVPSLTLSATTLSFTTAAVGTETVTITLVNNAESWSVGDITYTDGAGWLTAEKGTGADANTLTVGVSANTDAFSRRGSVALTPAGGAAVSLSVTQAGTAPSLTVSPTELSFAATETAAKTVAVRLYSADTWSVTTVSTTEGANWLTAKQGTGDDANTLSVTVEANTGITARRGSVALTPAQGSTTGDPVSLPVSQEPPPPSLSVPAASLSLSFTATGVAQRVTITLENADTWTGETSYTVGDGWITATPTQGTVDANTLEVTVAAHTGATDRSGSVVLTPAQGSTTGESVSLSVTQTPPPSLSVPAASLSLSFTATGVAQRVTITLLNADTWTGATSYTHGDGWITATPTQGTVDANTLEVTVLENAGTTERTGSVVLTPAQGGTTGESVSLTINQVGTPLPSLSVPAASLSLSFTATGEAQRVTITLLNATSWTGETSYTHGDGWITATPTQGTVDANTLTVAVSAHTGTEGRTGSVVLTPAQGGTTGSAVRLSVTQTPLPRLTIDTERLSFTSAGGTQTVAVTLLYADTWKEYQGNQGDWLRATKNGNTLTVTVQENIGTTARTGGVSLVPVQDGASGTAVSLTVTQTSPPTLTVASTLFFTAAGGTQTTTVELVNADSWAVGETNYLDGGGWITATPTQGTGEENTLTVAVSAYTGTLPRSADVRLMPTRGDIDGETVNLRVSQRGIVSFPSLSLSPTSLSLTARATTDPQTVAVTLINANSWDLGAVSTTDDVNWLTATKSTDANAPNTLTVAVTEHTGITDRTGSVELIPAQGTTTGESVTLSVTQTYHPGIILDPPSLDFPAAAGTQYVKVTLHNAEAWQLSSADSWVVLYRLDLETLQVGVLSNRGAARSRSIVLTPLRYGRLGPPPPVTLLVTQAAGN